jgi:hypothetical protein
MTMSATNRSKFEQLVMESADYKRLEEAMNHAYVIGDNLEPLKTCKLVDKALLEDIKMNVTRLRIGLRSAMKQMRGVDIHE